MTEQLEGQESWFGPATWSGRTSMDAEPRREENIAVKTLQRSSKKSSASQSRMPIFMCVPDGGWPGAGCYYAEDGSWSLAWRLVDAQYFGTPQRRVRVALLADFGGLSAPEIMFDPQLERTTEDGKPVSAVTDTSSGGQKISAQSEGLQGDSDSCEPPGEGTPAGAESGVGGTSYTLKIRGGCDIDSAGKRAGKGPLVQSELSGTLGVSQDQTLIQTGINGDIAGTLDASYYKGCGERQGIERDVVMEVMPYGISAYDSNSMEQHGVVTYDARGNGDGDVCCTLTGDHQDRVTDYTALVVENDSSGE